MTKTYERIVHVLTECLNVDAHEIRPESAIVDDLGAESIDFLDIVFRCEHEFGMKFNQKRLFPEFLFGGESMENGRLTWAGKEKLMAHFPFMGGSEIAVGDSPTKIFTVGHLAKSIDHEIARFTCRA